MLKSKKGEKLVKVKGVSCMYVFTKQASFNGMHTLYKQLYLPCAFSRMSTVISFNCTTPLVLFTEAEKKSVGIIPSIQSVHSVSS